MTLKTVVVMMVAAVAALTIFLGCAPPPKIMTGQYFRYDKDFEYMIQRADKRTDQLLAEGLTGQKQQDLFHFFIRLCDVDQAGQRVNCRDTLVLPYVFPQSIY